MTALAKLERLIRVGEGGDARRLLVQATAGRFPRADVAAIAQLAWRSHLPDLGAKLLNPFVRPPASAPQEATDAEKAEYAQCLTRIGASTEAENLLKKLDPAALPRVLHYRAANRFAQWDYSGGLALFRRYAAETPSGSYENLVARVNVAAALVAEGRALPSLYLLRELLHETGVRGARLLHGNALEISAQYFLARGEWMKAEECVRSAARVLDRSQGLDAFFARKWMAVIELRRNPGASLTGIREEASRLGHWETVRECDRLTALARRDAGLLAKVYFGTPYPHYRERLLREWGGEAPADGYRWELGRAPHAHHIRLLDGNAGDAARALKPGQSVHKLLVTLCSDLYRPFRIPTLFHALYPGEFYNPQTSPKRVHQAIGFLRRWFEANGLPLDIRTDDGEYRLDATAGCAIEMIPTTGDRVTILLARARAAWSAEAFSLKAAAALWGMSDRSASRVLKDGVENGRLHRTGARAFARYRLVEKVPG